MKSNWKFIKIIERRIKMNDFLQNVLIIGAQYDDSELGAGGVMARLVSEGKKVYKITLSSCTVKELNIDGKRTKECSAAACKVLGVNEIEFEGQEYGNVAFSQAVMQMLEGIIKSHKIDTAVIHHCEDFQSDHLASHLIAKVAGRHCKNILMFQSNPYITGFKPNFFVDISDYVQKKRDALACYDSEQNIQGRLFDISVKRNEVWGYGNEVQYAEGFEIVKCFF